VDEPEVTPPFTSHAFPQKDIVAGPAGRTTGSGRSTLGRPTAEGCRGHAPPRTTRRAGPQEFLNTHPNIPLDQLARDPEYGRLVQEENTFDRLAQETWTEYAQYGRPPEVTQRLLDIERELGLLDWEESAPRLRSLQTRHGAGSCRKPAGHWKTSA